MAVWFPQGEVTVPQFARTGSIYVIFGHQQGNPFPSVLTASSLDNTHAFGFRIDGVNNGDDAGRAISSAGDMNGDGINDLLMGAPFADYVIDPANPNNVIADVGSAYVLFGHGGSFTSPLSLATLTGTTGFRLDGDISLTDKFGYSVSLAGDVNGDGLDDLLVGAIDRGVIGQNKAGKSYVIFGRKTAFSSSLSMTHLETDAGWRLEGITTMDPNAHGYNARTGFSVSATGDVNRDGLNDLLIGAPSADPNGDHSGRAYVVFGNDVIFTDTFDSQ